MKPRPALLAVGLAVAAVAVVLVVGLAWNADRDDVEGASSAVGPALTPKLNPTVAERRCGKSVIEDWYVDGRVDRNYRPACYAVALGLLPTSPPVDSTVVEDITRAYRARRAAR